jgi:hypothetical protein
MGVMKDNDRDVYTARLAEHGLEIHSFDGQTLTLRYNPAADKLVELGQGADENELVQYARNSITDLPEAAHMFPGLDWIVVDFGPL